MTPPDDSPPATVTGVSGLIDVHTHFAAEAHREALERMGGAVDGSTLPAWNSERTLDVFGDVGIEYSVLSPALPLPMFTDLDDARRAAREFNEELADQIAEDPRTYGGVAALPLFHTDAALEELAYALDVLKLDGVHMISNYCGRCPGDEELEPLLQELDRRRTTVIAHATTPMDLVPPLHLGRGTADGDATAGSEFLSDTARLASNLLRSGVLERYRAISWILAHGGATILAGRHRPPDAVGTGSEPAAADPPDGVGDGADDGADHDPVRRLHVDVVGTVAEPELSGLAALQGPDKLLFGTDLPREPASQVAERITTLMANGAVGDDVRRAIARDNALALFPSVARKLRGPLASS